MIPLNGLFSSSIRKIAPETDKRREHQGNHDGAVRRREQAEADEQDGEPKSQDVQHGRGNRRVRLLELEPAHLAELQAGGQGLRFERGLQIVLRR